MALPFGARLFLGFLCLFLAAGPEASAQLLRIGPFDFDTRTIAGLVYSDNIDGARPSDQTLEPEDYYLTATFEVESKEQFGRDIDVTLSTGFTMERHFIRDDLDEEEISSGLVKVEAEKTLGRLTLNAFYTWERSQELVVDAYIPGEFRRKRNPSTLQEYGLVADLKLGSFTFGSSYKISNERFDKKEFQGGDKDTTEFDYFVAWTFRDLATVTYQMERTLEEVVNDPTTDAEWEEDETLTIDLGDSWNLWRKPQVTFKFGIKREDENGEKGEWEPTYTLRVSDLWEFGPRLSLSAYAQYEFEETEEADDVAFTYGALLAHDISAVARHTLSAEREPRDTFGSTQDTDTSTFTYLFTLRDVPIPELLLSFEATHEINIPVSGPEERITTYIFRALHNRPISTRVTRTLRYEYSQEESSLFDELLIENRVEWLYAIRW